MFRHGVVFSVCVCILVFFSLVGSSDPAAADEPRAAPKGRRRGRRRARQEGDGGDPNALDYVCSCGTVIVDILN